ncbi:MAG: M20/M25/M40 family metallo-hydrolase [Acidobacteriota bacterium]
MQRRLRLTIAVLLLTLLAAEPAPATTERELPLASLQASRVQKALSLARRHHRRNVLRWTELCRIPALSGQEEARAKEVREQLAALGLKIIDRTDGNVEAVLVGRRPELPPGVLCAHLDALHAPTEENPIRLNGTLLTGPGVLDDGSGLAGLLTAARSLTTVGYQGERSLHFLATVREEVGLEGMKSYLETASPLPAAVVSIDGILGGVDYGATGIIWKRFRFLGRGGHALLSPRTPSPAFGAGRAIAGLADLAEEIDVPLNVGVLQGGTRPNAIPAEVSFTVDVRSTDAEELARLERQISRIVRSAAAREAVKVEEELLQGLPAARLPGHGRSRLVLGAVDILEWLGVPARAHPRGSSDHNVALLRGIPAIAVGTTVGRGAHSPAEQADTEAFLEGSQQVILLAVLLGEGLENAPGPQAAQ